ncbi:MAG: hypothetical protein IAI50_10090 [Candidatus Eremiobacteraeota bacterium]|nr:hypothetical protein [Candidatus Eremiobacteraeota bacterium]
MPPIGSVATLGPGASHGEEVGRPCLPSRSELDATLGMARGRGATGRRPTDDAVPLAPHLHVRLLAREAAGRDVRLRLLDGPWAGVACWVDASADGLF